MRKTIRGLIDSSGANWDPLFAKYYALTRQEIYPSEIDFWRSLCHGKKHVLEIGAGSGFIASRLLDLDIRSLTLVEPEEENVLLLRSMTERVSDSVAVTIFDDVFQAYRAQASHDLIFTSWDNLCMFPERSERARIFSRASDALVPNGLFVFHLSSESFHFKDYQSCRTPLRFAVDLGQGETLELLFSIRQEGDGFFVKHIELKEPGVNRWRSYVLPTVTVSPSEIRELAAQTGLEIVDCYHTFERTKVEMPDDYIWVLRKLS